MQDINVVIAGAAGEGIQTIGTIVSRTVLDQGYAVFTWQEYESRIRGGQNSYSIRISDQPHNAPLVEADGLLALNVLHGRALPAVIGINVANPRLTIMVVTGDGDCYGEGGNHLLHALRRNPDITMVVRWKPIAEFGSEITAFSWA